MVVDRRQAHHAPRDGAYSFFCAIVAQVDLSAQHSRYELEVVSDAMLQLSCQDILLVQQRLPLRQQMVLLDDHAFHLFHSGAQNGNSPRGSHRFGNDIGKAGQEVDVMLIEFARLLAVDLENAPRLARAFDQDIGRGDDFVLRIERPEAHSFCYA